MSIRTSDLAQAFTLVLSLMFAASAYADSQARVVRLSDVQGDVQINRTAGKGYEKGFLNLPITQGDKLRTGVDGRAQVEFEDGSSVRITPNSLIDLPASVVARFRRKGLHG